MTRTVAAQTASPSAPDLDCTYYDVKTVPPTPHAGTCEYDPKDKKQYLCYLNSDATQSENQTACEWKLRRVEEWKRRQAEDSKRSAGDGGPTGSR